MRLRRFAWALACLLLPIPAIADSTPVDLERLTSPEVAALQAQGWTTIIVPTGGTEQNGPHLILGKHNITVHDTADEIARRLGKTLVAPVIAYVPEGNIDPPDGHMTSPGTISLPEPVFAAVLDATARSFIATGFKTVLFIGDSGGNQPAQDDVAAALDQVWRDRGVRVFAVDAYYAGNGQIDWLKQQGLSDAEIGAHAGVRETSELLAIDPTAVRPDRLTPDQLTPGNHGQLDKANADWGRQMLELKITAALAEIRRLTATTP